MEKSMKFKKSILIKLIISLIVVIFCIANIVFVNITYGIEPKKTYKMNEDVTWNGYTINVKSYEILNADEAEARYPGSKAVLKDQATSREGAVIIIKCIFSSDKVEGSLPAGCFHAESGSWANGLSREMNSLIDPEFYKLKSGENEVLLAFEYGVQQSSDFDFEKIKNKKYELIVNLTPVISIEFQ